MGLLDMFDTGIMIDSRDATADKGKLSEGAKCLHEALDALQYAQESLAGGWKGDAAIRCDELLEGFIRQTRELIDLTQTAQNTLSAIVDIYHDADRALRNKL